MAGIEAKKEKNSRLYKNKKFAGELVAASNNNKNVKYKKKQQSRREEAGVSKSSVHSINMAPRGGFNGGGGTRGGRSSSSTQSSSGGVSASVGGLSLGSSGGEDQVSSSIAHREGLQQLWIDGATLMPSGSLSTVIRDSFKTYMSHEGFTWRLVPDNGEEIYFDEFKEEVHAIVEEQSHFPGLLSRMRST